MKVISFSTTFVERISGLGDFLFLFFAYVSPANLKEGNVSFVLSQSHASDFEDNLVLWVMESVTV